MMLNQGCTGYRFDCFEVELSTGRLLRNSHKVRIQRLPFQMLVALLEHSGRTVSQAELRSELWSGREFLEFDNNLRVAVVKLREALGDQATEPRFIKTVTREGYQFIGEVRAVFSDIPASAVQTDRQEPALEAAASDSEIHVDRKAEMGSEARAKKVEGRWSATRQGRLFWPSAASAAILVLAALVFAAYRYAQRPLYLGDESVVLGDVRNATGDPLFNELLSAAFRLKMQESPYLNLIAGREFGRLVQSNGVASELGAELRACRLLGATIFLDGRMSGQAGSYALVLHAWRCSDGNILETVHSEAKTQADVLLSLDADTERMRRRLGEPASSTGRYNVPLTQATTASLLALKAYSLGEEKHQRGQDEQSISDLKLAVDLDPQFALAYARLGTAYLNTRKYSEARTAYQKAFALRERTTDRERLYIAAQYDFFVIGDAAQEIEAYRLWANVYPLDTLPVENLANAYLQLGQADEALKMAQASIRLAPSSSSAYALEARAYLGLGRYGELDKLCADPVRSQTNMMLFHSTCYLSAFAQGNERTEEKELEWAQSSPQRSVMLEYRAWGEVYEGKARQAATTFDEARKSALASGMTEFVAELYLDEGLLDADTGLASQARQHAFSALQVEPGSGYVQAAAALALARSGQASRARSVAAKAASEMIGNATLYKPLLVSTRASLQLQEHDPQAAMQSMRSIQSLDDVAFMALSPAYYRGLALIELQQYETAALAFREVIAHRMLYPASIYSELAQLSLGRSLALEGKRSAAQEQFREMDMRWKEADPDFAPLQQLRVLEKRTGR